MKSQKNGADKLKNSRKLPLVVNAQTLEVVVVEWAATLGYVEVLLGFLERLLAEDAIDSVVTEGVYKKDQLLSNPFG